MKAALNDNPFKRVLPFRFIAAARHAPEFEVELEGAMLRSLGEMPKLPGKTALVLDHSGSMCGAKISQKSELDRADAAAALAILVREVCAEVVVIAFSSAVAWQGEHNAQDAVIVPARRGFALADAYRTSMHWFGTNTESGKQLADRQGYDRIVVVTDEQSHQSVSNPTDGARGYFLNVGTYRNGIGYGAWTHIDGWSESVVRYIQEAENAERIASTRLMSAAAEAPNPEPPPVSR